MNNRGFLSKDITVNDLITHRSDIHNIFPHEYLKSRGLKRGDYKQVANYVYMQSEINVQIGNKAPVDYFRELIEQCNGGALKYGGINDLENLKDNLKANCVPESIFTMDINNYDGFLKQRRVLMANKMREYYLSL